MNNAEAAAIRNRAAKAAIKKGFREHAEDLAHDVVVKRLEGIGLRQRIDHSVIDAARVTIGDTREVYYPGETKELKDHHAKENRSPELRMDFERVIKSLKSSDRAMIHLRFVWGFSHREIGTMWGIGEIAIGQRMKKILDRVRLVREKLERRVK